MLTMDRVSLYDKWVLIREDFNVPMTENKITHTARIDAALGTLKKAMAQKAKVIVMSHLGRPKEGEFDPLLSLKPVADYLSQCLNQPVPLFTLGDKVPSLQPGQIALLENVRFLVGEEKNANELAKTLASLCDVFVMDAFAVAHRLAASTCGVAKYAPVACAGPLLQAELKAIQHVLMTGQRPIVAIVGGSKVSSKLTLLTNLLDKVDSLVVGGGIANTFLAAKGFPMGASLYEASLVPIATSLLEKAKALGKTIWLPEDVVVAPLLSQEATGVVKLCQEVSGQDKILDIGPISQASLKACLMQANTIVWNGPVGVFEYAPFASGTKSLSLAISESTAYSVAGGGDTLAAIEQFQVQGKISYLSTGGGAFLEALEGKTLPAVAALVTKNKENIVL